MIDLNGIFEALTGINNQRAAAAEQQAAQQAQVTTDLEAQGRGLIDQSRQIVADKAAVENEQAGIDLIRAELIQQFQRTAGLDPNDLNNEFVQSIAEMNSAEERRKQVRAQINQYQGATMLGNPLDWLIGQMALPQLVAENNALVDERDAAVKNLTTRHQLLQNQKSIVIADTATQAARVQRDRVALAAREANLKLAAEESKLGADIAARRLNEYRLQDTAMEMRGKNFETALRIEDIQVNRQMRQLQYESLIETRNAQLRSKAEQAAAEAQANMQLQRVAKFFGLPESITVDQLKLLPLDPKSKEILNRAALTGSLGSDMGDVLSNISTFQGALTAIQRDNPMFGQVITNTAESAKRYADAIAAKAVATGRKFKAGELEAEAFSEYEADIKNAANVRNYAKPMNSPAWDTAFNPLKVNHKLMLNVIDEGRAKFLTENQYVAALKGVGAFVPPEAKDYRGEDETKALQVMVERVKKREIAPAEAAKQITEYYNAGRFINADLTKYGILGLPIPDAYHVTLPSSGIWGKPQSANLLNPADVERMLIEGAKAGLVSGIMQTRNPDGSVIGFPTQAPNFLKQDVADFLRGYKLPDSK